MMAFMFLIIKNMNAAKRFESSFIKISEDKKWYWGFFAVVKTIAGQVWEAGKNLSSKGISPPQEPIILLGKFC